MRVGYTIFILFLSFSLLGFLNVCNAHRLRYNFYKETCPQANWIVKQIITNETRTNPALGAHLIRMQFHDCFVRGCDGLVLLDTVNNGSKVEKDAIPNRSLKGFDVIDDIKNAIEKVCPNVVSCADILALAARDAVSAPFKRRLWNVALGRRDGRISLASETNGNIPSPFADFTSLLETFNNKTLDVNDLVVLSGAHTIGVAHCGTFSRRLYNFTGKGDADPTLDPTYADILRKQCPSPANPNTIVEMDPGSSRSFNKHYYHILRQNKGLFISDAALLTNKESESIVIRLQRSRGLFFAAFARSMRKMAAIDVLTGNDGEIRRNCRVVNP
ncbi:hypothetical protein ES332_A09G076800v1 [Gossypium tomentosum]|uniref:Peroxidase n=1 Tax=Gossypium tomentosum TaxID=34277 RepID=A0A5D2NZJ2_GOSTO|nr:hypothetical protein ES332_A09G076800v1 [Gossypium tomentosum]